MYFGCCTEAYLLHVSATVGQNLFGRAEDEFLRAERALFNSRCDIQSFSIVYFYIKTRLTQTLIIVNRNQSRVIVKRNINLSLNANESYLR